MTESRLDFDLNGVRVKKQARNRGQPQDVDGVGQPVRIRHLAVCPFRVIVDSREQLPYEFSGMGIEAGETFVVSTVVKGLPAGDYSIEGHEGSVSVERKSLDDLYGSVTWGRARFEREIVKLNNYPGFACVVIEATWPEIVNPAEHRPGWINQTEPRSVEGTIVAWSIRYPRVHWWACGSRRDAENLTFSILKKFWDEIHKP